MYLACIGALFRNRRAVFENITLSTKESMANGQNRQHIYQKNTLILRKDTCIRKKVIALLMYLNRQLRQSHFSKKRTTEDIVQCFSTFFICIT